MFWLSDSGSGWALPLALRVLHALVFIVSEYEMYAYMLHIHFRFYRRIPSSPSCVAHTRIQLRNQEGERDWTKTLWANFTPKNNNEGGKKTQTQIPKESAASDYIFFPWIKAIGYNSKS